MQRCSEKAFAACPDRRLCGRVFDDGSLCAAFNQKVERNTTNADKIRAMSDQELAEFLVYSAADICDQCTYRGHCTSKCIGGVKKWLQQPAEGEH